MSTTDNDVQTGTTLEPGDLGELRDAVVDSTGPLVVRGGGTASDWGGAVARPHTVLSTCGLTGVIAHNPGDMTVSVRAGTPLEQLQRELAGCEQRVAIDPARARRGATLGGIFATADSGPLAYTFGSLRDLVIGATIVLADGTVARSGGHVIKNVAGYDLTKLLHGAYGTFAVLAELILRLHPVPPATRTVALDTSLDEAAAAGLRAIAGPAEPTALQWCAGRLSEPGRLLVRVEGTPDGVAGRARRIAEALGGGASVLEPAEAESAWAAEADEVDAQPDDGAVLRLGVMPTRLTDVLRGLDVEVGLASVSACPANGVATCTVPARPEAVAAAHTRVAAAGGTTSLRHRPAGLDLPAWGPAPSSSALLRAVSAAVDPEQRLGRGRFDSWLPGSAGAQASETGASPTTPTTPTGGTS